MSSPAVSPPQARWVLRDRFAKERAIPRFPPIVAEVLAARGIHTRQAADEFYKPHLLPDSDPLLMTGMREAVDRVRAAITAREVIGLFGDYDVDGVTSVALLELALRPLDAITTTYLPGRFDEGYGLNDGAIDTLNKRGVSLIITADCGISSVSEVDYARHLGIDVVILDHHTVPSVMPAAVAAVNPKREDSRYPFTELAAVGVAFRFLHVLYDEFARAFPADEYIDLVALGTVVDVAPLEAENRKIVSEGIKRMQRGLRPGLDALAEVARTRRDRITAATFGFGFGPRLNAAGRLEHADIALELLLADNPLRARQVAEKLERLNRQRQDQTEDAYARAEEMLGASDDPLLLVGGDFHRGIVGLVAGRLAQRWHRPAIAYGSAGNGESTASARSIPGFDIVGAIRKERDLLVKHGGHRAAAGFTIKDENLPRFRERLLNTAAELLDERALRPSVEIDAEVRLADVAGLEVRGLMAFEPCGQGNTRPVLLSRSVEVKQARPVGADGKHLKMVLKQGPAVWSAIAFNRTEDDLGGVREIDIAYSLQHGWQGDTVEMEVMDLAPSYQHRAVEYGNG
jgi:single-stranded-DNA-specific exonuclease